MEASNPENSSRQRQAQSLDYSTNVSLCLFVFKGVRPLYAHLDLSSPYPTELFKTHRNWEGDALSVGLGNDNADVSQVIDIRFWSIPKLWCLIFDAMSWVGETRVSVLLQQGDAFLKRVPLVSFLQSSRSEMKLHASKPALTGSARNDGEYSPLYRIFRQE